LRDLLLRHGKALLLLGANFLVVWIFRSDANRAFSILAALWSAAAGALVLVRPASTLAAPTVPASRDAAPRRRALARAGASIATVIATDLLTTEGARLLAYPSSWAAAVAAGIAAGVALLPEPERAPRDARRRTRGALTATAPVVIAALVGGPAGRKLPALLLPLSGTARVFSVTRGGKVGLIDARGRVVAPPGVDDAPATADDVFAVEVHQRWAFEDAAGHRIGWETAKVDGKTVEQPKFVAVSGFSDGLAAAAIEVKNKGTLWGYVDRKGDFTIEPRFAEAGDFHDGLAAVLVPNGGRGAWGFIDHAGRYAVEPRFDWASAFVRGFAHVGRRSGCPGCAVDKFQLVDRTGRSITADELDGIGDMTEGLAWILSGSKVGYIDSTGRVVVKPTYDGHTTNDFSEGRAHVQTSDGKHGFIDKTGTLVVPARFTGAAPFKGGRARVWTDDGMGYIDDRGTLVVAPQFFTGGDFAGGLALVYAREAAGAIGKAGYIDTSGRFVVPPRFDRGRDFAHGLAAVEIGGKWGYIDEEGDFAVRPIFSSADDFTEPIARVTVDDRSAYIDRAGRYVARPEAGTWRPAAHGSAGAPRAGAAEAGR